MILPIAARSEPLGELIGREPALAIFVSARATSRRHKPPNSIVEAADWLASHLVAELATGMRSDWSQGGDVDLARAATVFEKLSVQSLEVALNAERLAKERQLDLGAARYWSLVRSRPLWIAAVVEQLCSGRLDVRSSDEDHPATPLNAAIAACIADATAQAPPKSRNGREAGGAERRAVLAQCQADWREVSAWGELLPRLIEKLAAAERLEAEFQSVLEQEKLESLKELAYGAGHEINNPLANISLRAQALIKEEQNPERRRRLAGIVTQVNRAHEMIADMMLFARPPQIERESLDLGEMAQAAMGSLSSLATSKGANVSLSAPREQVLIWADRAQIAIVLQSLVTNALEAVDEGGKVRLTINNVPDSHPAMVEIVVTDSGVGISGETRRHLFDPFYSGREAGRGLGFGLSKCWRIVTGHGGRIEVASPPNEGATFTVTLPRSDENGALKRGDC